MLLSLPLSSAPLRFGANTANPKQTLANALRNQAVVTPDGQESPREALEKKVAFEKRSWRILLALPPVFLSLGGLVATGSARMITGINTEIKQLKAESGLNVIPISHQESNLTFFNWLFINSLVLSTLFAGVATTMLLRQDQDFKKALQDAQEFDATSVTIKGHADPENQALCQILNRRIDAACKRYAQQFQTLYQSNDAIRQNLDTTFGGPQELPTAGQLRKLFDYMAFQKGKLDRSFSQLKGLPFVTEKQHLETVYALMKAGQIIGDPFECLIEKPDTLSQQAFNDAVLGQVAVAELQVQAEITHLTPLLHKKLQIEDHLSTARKALTKVSMSAMSRSEQDQQEKIRQIEAALSVFTQAQQQLEAAINAPFKQEEIPARTQEILLSEMDVSLNETLLTLNAALLTHQEEQTFQTALQQALSTQTP